MVSRRFFLFRAVPAVVSTVAFFDIGAAYAKQPHEFDWAQKRLGIDVARFGEDRTVQWLVVWGADTPPMGIFPKGSYAGLIDAERDAAIQQAALFEAVNDEVASRQFYGGVKASTWRM